MKLYVQGKLAMAGLDTHAPLTTYLAAVYAILAEAPHDRLEGLMDRMITGSAMADPDGARDTWGLQPEHLARAMKAEAAPAVKGGT